jgi:sensor histidine kinase YesM
LERKISLYWKCQVIGWSVASLYWGYMGFLEGGFNLLLGLLQLVSDVFIYILLTHLYRNFSSRQHWRQLNLRALLKRIIPSIFMMGIAYTVVTVLKIYLFRWWFLENLASFSSFLQVNAFSIFIAGIRLMSIWLLAYHLYQYAQREILIAKENARLEIITREARLSNLSAQLNPHFLFNSLNNVKSLILENPVSARRAIDLLSDLLRAAVYGKHEQLVMLEAELELVNDYLELEKMRLEERIGYQIEIEDGLEQILIPRFGIQTLVENAIKHGVSHQKEGGLININVIEENGLLRITVQNPGRLDLQQSREGLGLRNLQERLLLEFKGKADFEISQSGEKVQATLCIPVI